MTEKEHNYYERIRANFIGQKIIGVYYEEVGFEGDSEFWEMSDEIHSVDLNVIFKLENNQLLQIKWDNEFYCYGIGFERIQAIKQREATKTIELLDNPNWNRLFQKKIIGIKVLWDISEGINTTYSGNKIVKQENRIVKLPQTWELEFENDRVWISTIEIESDNQVNFWADHLTLVFTDREQEKYKLVEKAQDIYYINSSE